MTHEPPMYMYWLQSKRNLLATKSGTLGFSSNWRSSYVSHANVVSALHSSYVTNTTWVPETTTPRGTPGELTSLKNQTTVYMNLPLLSRRGWFLLFYLFIFFFGEGGGVGVNLWERGGNTIRSGELSRLGCHVLPSPQWPQWSNDRRKRKETGLRIWIFHKE